MNLNKSIIFLIIFSAVIFYSCYENIVDAPKQNLPPDTKLFLFADSISSQPSRINIHWSGDDPDGFVIGFYFSWDGTNWTFTPNNDSLFALQIGAVDTSYIFKVAAVDNSGNGIYDNSVVQNNINFGPEPFIDENGNGVYDAGEFFYDIGLIDPTPAELVFPIKNTAPEIFWNAFSFLPDTSFPVMTFAWEAMDLDGDESIERINIALNDTNNFVSLNGAVRRITIRTSDFISPNPLMEILIEGNPANIVPEKLPGLQLNSDNVLYVQAVDISGASSPFIRLPGEEQAWHVKKPKGNLLIVDDHATNDNAPEFYYRMMDSLGLITKHDVYDLRLNAPPFLNLTFLETIKLFDYVIWYADNSPSLDLALASTQKYLDANGKILFSMQFPAIVDLQNIQGFLPIIPDSSDTRNFLFSGVVLSADTTAPVYPPLEVTSSLPRPRSFYLDELGVIPIYYFPNQELRGYIGFSNSQKNLFFMGLPLHRINGGSANVKAFLQQVLFYDFGLMP
jgi:hypothetical protein